MDLLKRISEYFADWNGEDETVTDIKLSTEDLRLITNLHTQNCKLKYCENIIRYLALHHPEQYDKLLNEMAIDR